jgi:hypothetical protein
MPVQIRPTDSGGKLRFDLDHVLAEMVRGLGCTVRETQAPFQPDRAPTGGTAVITIMVTKRTDLLPTCGAEDSPVQETMNPAGVSRIKS